MLSSARRAQLGLVGVALVFGSSIAVLGEKAIARRWESRAAALDISLVDIDGRSVNLASLRGNVVMLVFSTAKDRDTQRFVDYANRYAANDSRVHVFMIDPEARSADTYAMDELRVRRAVAGQRFQTLLDPRGNVSRFCGIQGTPSLCIIGPDGSLRYRGDIDDSADPKLAQHPGCEDVLAGLLSGRPT